MVNGFTVLSPSADVGAADAADAVEAGACDAAEGVEVGGVSVAREDRGPERLGGAVATRVTSLVASAHAAAEEATE